MLKIWYRLKCPKGNEADYVEKCQKAITSDHMRGLKEAVYFQYQRMIRYGGQWHLEKKPLMPGYIFLSGTEASKVEGQMREEEKSHLEPCEISYLKTLCSKGNLIGMSRGIIKNGMPVVTSGPLWGREKLIRRIDRHKRTAEIGIPFGGQEYRVTVGLEIYEKQV